ncbi:MAG: caspase family protein [Deltaproteobacteria bacterium]|nr:caspase family protein [Deltaproteobacteria bacterium]
MIALVAALLLAAPPSPPEAARARFTIVVGNNDGGSERERLRWAVRDAERVAEVLTTLGGVAPERATLLREPTPAALEAALVQVTGAVVQARGAGTSGAVELVFYYSGHADPAGLLLGAERFAYARLRQLLQAIPADVTIVVLDACASGAILRGKGGTPEPAFLGAAPAATGHAYLTSAAADEVAQESDRLQASFFTHHFIAALRGAADRSGDGRVTLVEAYEHAYHETLSGTAETLAGPQHPSYDIALAGRGDVVLTELARASRLVLDLALAGRVFVRDASGRLVAEVDKRAGAEVQLALPPGRHTVAAVVDRRVRATTVELGATPARVGLAALVDRGPALEARERGGSLLVDKLPRPERRAALRLSVVPLLGFEGGGDDLAVGGLALAILADRVASVRGVQIAGLYGEADEVVGLQLGAVVAAGSVRGSQVGLVTYARRVEGVALALVPWVDDGVHVVESWLDTRGGLALGYRLGPRHLHVAGSVGWRPLASYRERSADRCDGAALGLAMGSRVALGPLDLDLDLGVRFAIPGCDTELALESRAVLGWRFAGGLALIAGGGLAGTASGDGTAFGILGIRFDDATPGGD